MALTIQYKRTDQRPPLAVQLLEGGNPVDLTGCTARLVVRRNSDRAVVIDAAMEIESAASGTVSYAWTANDTTLAGNYSAEVIVTDAAGKPRTYPTVGAIALRLEPNLPPAA